MVHRSSSITGALPKEEKYQQLQSSLLSLPLHRLQFPSPLPPIPYFRPSTLIAVVVGILFVYARRSPRPALTSSSDTSSPSPPCLASLRRPFAPTPRTTSDAPFSPTRIARGVDYLVGPLAASRSNSAPTNPAPIHQSHHCTPQIRPTCLYHVPNRPC